MLVVRDGEAWVLIDGYLRVVVLGKLARDLVDAAVMDVAEAEALVLGHRLDNGRERTGLEEGWLLRDLVERHGVVQAELARGLDRSASWVSRRLALQLARGRAGGMYGLRVMSRRKQLRKATGVRRRLKFTKTGAKKKAARKRPRPTK